MVDEPTPVTVVELSASNVMRLSAVEIRPDPDDNVVIIGGANGAGKSSVLNSIWLALGGAPAAKNVPDPVRHGAETGTIRLDLGRFVVTRKFTAGARPELTVTAPDGTRFASPQKFLDEFLGAFTFDPLSFMRQSPKDQLATLLPLVELPFDLAEKNAERQTHYEERTVIGRDRDNYRERLAAAEPPGPDTPTDEVSITDLVTVMRAARAEAATNTATRTAEQTAAAKVAAAETEVERLTQALRTAASNLEAAQAAHNTAAEAVTALPPDPDIAWYESQINTAETINQQVRAANTYRELAAATAKTEAAYDDETLLIAMIDGEKKRAIKEAAMPLDKLTFDDNQVYFREIPLQQCSGAEQLRVSIAIGMAANPTVRVMCIPDASLLDETSMRHVAAMAAANQYQVWLEVISTDGASFVIEDGAVVDQHSDVGPVT